MPRFLRYIKINEKDNVAVLLEDMEKGEAIEVNGSSIKAEEAVKLGNKLALAHIPQGGQIIKYGFSIGYAVNDIEPGELVHSHNLKTNLNGLEEYSYNPAGPEVRSGAGSTVQGLPRADRGRRDVFMGYAREDGQVGIRNEVWIINTVGCINKTAEILAGKANNAFGGRAGGVFSFSHPYGCSQLGDDLSATQKILAGLARHPNAAGILVLGLGCENNNIAEFRKVLGRIDKRRVRFLSVQEHGNEIEEGLRLLDELTAYASSFKRSSCPLSKLVIGLKCGGSDAFSGISANPLMGRVSDMFIRQGASAILSEVPEMFGAEKLLMERCVSRKAFDGTVGLINDFKKYFIRYGQEIYENPSPGNKEGGITTLEEKSLGCTQKGGTSSIVDVLDYGERAMASGLNLLKAPGNDMVSSTAITAAGAQILLFSTGRGTPLGAPVPTLKISSNSQLYNSKPGWIDFNAGRVIEGLSLEKAGSELFELVVKIASGEVSTRNEQNGYREIAIFKDGVTL